MACEDHKAQPQGLASITVVCVTVLAGWVGADAAQSASPSDQTIAANATVLDSRTIGAGSSYTVNLTQVPADAVSANFSVTAQPTRQSTRVSLCSGGVVTTACKSPGSGGGRACR